MAKQQKGLCLYPLASWLIYIVLAVLMTWPLSQHLGTRLGGRDTDIFNVYWGNWWVSKALSTGQNPYMTKYLLYPVGFDLTTFAFSPFLALLRMPLAKIVPPTMAYNLIVLITIVLNCVAMDCLIRYLTGNAGAALVAGIVLGFAPCLAAERAAHLNLSVVAWIPWAALFMTRLTRERRVRDAILFAVVIGLSFLTRLHIGALVLMFTAVYFVGLALVEWKGWSWRVIRGLVLAGLLSALILSPLLLHVWRVLEQPGGENLRREGAGENQTDLLAYVVPPPQHPVFGSLTEPVYEQRFVKNTRYWAFVGFVPLVLCVYAIWSSPRKALPWLLTGLFFSVLALGPFLRVNGRVYQEIKLPYGLATGFFATIGFDVPNRFNLAMMPTLAVLAGLACAQALTRLHRPWSWFVPAVLILFEYLIVPLPLMYPPSHSPFYDQMAADGEDYAVVDLPLKRAEGEVHRYYQTMHHKPIVGGWDHRVPPSAFSFIDENPLLSAWRRDVPWDTSLQTALNHLSQANVRYIILHKNQLRWFPEGLRSLFLTLKPVYEDSSVYVLPTDVKPARDYSIVHAFAESVALIRPTVTLEVSEGGPALLFDTCWLLGDTGDSANSYQVTLTDPSGGTIGEENAVFPSGGQMPMCQDWSLALAPPFLAGNYEIGITPFLDKESLGTWTVDQPIQVVEDRDGVTLPLMGRGFPVAFDAPIEMLGYNVAIGEDIVWIDMYWRGLADHNGAYVLFVQLLNPVTKEQVVRTSDDIIHKLEWSEGDIVHERRVLTVNDIPQGQYALAVGLYPSGEPGKRIAAFDQRDGRQWPGKQAILDAPVLVLPRAQRDTPVSNEGRIIVYTTTGEQGLAGSQQPEGAADVPQVGARFGDIARLAGYISSPQQVVAGQNLEVTLYWEAIITQPVDADYTVFVHLLDESHRVIAQHDGKPVGGTRPTSTWQPGDKIVDAHRLVWLVQDYAGIATVEAGLYDLQTGQRLPTYGAAGERLPDDRILLGQVEVVGTDQ